MWLLHARADLFRRGFDARRPGTHARRDPRADERQHLPLRRLRQHRCRHRTSDGSGQRECQAVNSFSYTRAADVASAVREVASDGGASFIAGGTNLIDLMKENVSKPSRLVDITRLPLNRIEELP